MFIYHSSPEGKFRTTVVGQLRGDDLFCSVATVGDGDTFVKREGVEICLTRLAINDVYHMETIKGKLLGRQFRKIAEKLAARRIREVHNAKVFRYWKKIESVNKEFQYLLL